MRIGLKIKMLAEEKNVDAVWISKKLGKSKQAIYDIYDKEDVNTSILKSLAQVFNVPVGYFFDDEASPVSQNTASVKGNNNVLVGGNNNTIHKLNECEREVEVLRVEVKHLTTQVEEKERLIQVLMNK